MRSPRRRRRLTPPNHGHVADTRHAIGACLTAEAGIGRASLAAYDDLTPVRIRPYLAVIAEVVARARVLRTASGRGLAQEREEND